MDEAPAKSIFMLEFAFEKSATSAIMQLTHDKVIIQFQITAYEPGQISVNKNLYQHSLIIAPDKLTTDWQPQRSLELLPGHLALILSQEPEIILVGTGELQHTIPASTLAVIYEKRIGIEVMSTFAACKTFNLLAADGRRVVAGLFA